jgi:hypothetical protein
MNYKLRFATKIIFVLVAIAALGWLVMSLWNWIIPTIFIDAHSIDYVRALGLIVLCRILFGGFHGRGGWHKYRHMQHWEQMTPEEKEKFKRGIMGFHARHHGHHD